MKIPHITIHVKDIEKSITFYKEVAGIKIQADIRPMGAPIVFMADEADDTKIELIDDPGHSYVGTGISVGFATDDAERELERIKGLGYRTTDMICPNPQTKFFLVMDPDGFNVQIIQH